MTYSMRQVALLASLNALLSACGGSPTGPTIGPTTVTAVTVALSPRSAGDPYQGPNTFYDLGQTNQLTATATLINGATQTVTNSAKWQTSRADVAMISNIGLLTSTGAGTTTVTATYQGTSGTLLVTATYPE
jgi:hypothetical protein